jgi:hypothetical protein
LAGGFFNRRNLVDRERAENLHDAARPADFND